MFFATVSCICIMVFSVSCLIFNSISSFFPRYFCSYSLNWRSRSWKKFEHKEEIRIFGNNSREIVNVIKWPNLLLGRFLIAIVFPAHGNNKSGFHDMMTLGHEIVPIKYYSRRKQAFLSGSAAWWAQPTQGRLFPYKSWLTFFFPLPPSSTISSLQPRIRPSQANGVMNHKA